MTFILMLITKGEILKNVLVALFHTITINGDCFQTSKIMQKHFSMTSEAIHVKIDAADTPGYKTFQNILHA